MEDCQRMTVTIYRVMIKNRTEIASHIKNNANIKPQQVGQNDTYYHIEQNQFHRS